MPKGCMKYVVYALIIVGIAYCSHRARAFPKRPVVITELGKPLPYKLLPDGTYYVFVSFAKDDEKTAYAILMKESGGRPIFVETTGMNKLPEQDETYKVETVGDKTRWTRVESIQLPKSKEHKSDAPVGCVASSF